VRATITNEVGPTCCRTMPAVNQSADETRASASQCLPAVPLETMMRNGRDFEKAPKSRHGQGLRKRTTRNRSGEDGDRTSSEKVDCQRDVIPDSCSGRRGLSFLYPALLYPEPSKRSK
jgi:hypothetical protein